MRGNGFTLIEIMVVVAIICILVAMAIPNILRSRFNASESAALTSLRTISNACQLYYSREQAYPETLSVMVEPAMSPPYLDTELATGRKQGYEFVYQRPDVHRFNVNANCLWGGLLKSRYFYLNELGVIRVNAPEIAGADDEIIG